MEQWQVLCLVQEERRGISPCQRVQVSIRYIPRFPHVVGWEMYPFHVVAPSKASSGLPETTLLNKGTLCWLGRSDTLEAPQIANCPLAK